MWVIMHLWTIKSAVPVCFPQSIELGHQLQEELEPCVNTEGGPKTGSVLPSKARTVYDTKAWCDASIRTCKPSSVKLIF